MYSCAVFRLAKKFVLLGDAGNHDKSHVKTRRISKGKANRSAGEKKKKIRGKKREMPVSFAMRDAFLRAT